MDNALTHMADEVEEAFQDVGTILIYEPPYSPNLDPIKPFFGKYKGHLKRNGTRMLSDWYSVHLHVLNVINRDDGIKFFRHCNIPGAKTMLKLDEYHKLIRIYN